MADHIDQTVADLQQKLRAQEEEALKTKQLINLLCTHAGKPAPYGDAELTVSEGSYSIAADEFYGQTMGKAMRKILEKRKAANLGPATPREIYEDLLRGGFAFETDNEANRLTGLRISLRKSSSVFHRLPDGKKYGLVAWYPKIRKSQKADVDDDASGDVLDKSSVENDDTDGD